MAKASVSRRALIKATGAIGASVLPGGLNVHNALAQEPHATPAPFDSSTPRPLPAQGQSTTYLFLNMEEAAFIEAAVARLIPADDTWPGGLEAGVAN
jgi:gluconate 2-dehydrogenase gamma chain